MSTHFSRRNFLLALCALAAGSAGCMAIGDMEEALAEHPEEIPNNGLVPLIYSKNYNIGAFCLEKLHPFDSRKYEKIYEEIKNCGFREHGQFVRPKAMSEKELLIVHTQRYLKSLHNSHELAKILEVGPAMMLPSVLLDWKILKPMRIAAGGTLLACRAALTNGIAINLGGGYHHASSDQGGGFCVYSDVPIAIKTLQREGLIKTALIVDTDAHQGNGFAMVASESDSKICVLDFFDESIYPYPKVSEDWSVPFPENTSGRAYLKTLAATLPQAVEKYKPDLIVYNAGSDVLESDPLSSFTLSPKDMNRRDLHVVEYARSEKIPVAMVLAGGYSKESALAHASSIKKIIQKFDQKTL